MTLILIGIHVLVCLFLIFVVLLQSAQAADLAGAFGGGGSQTALGMRGATTLLQKATTAAAVIFMLTSLTLGMMDRTSSSLIEGLDSGAPAAAPETPGPADVEQADDGAADGEAEAGDQGNAEAGSEQGADGGEQGSGSDPEQQ